MAERWFAVVGGGLTNNMTMKANYLGGFQLLRHVPEGCCLECAVKHEPEQPHNQQSLFYQYQFLEKHGRWPTWHDALRHCDPSLRERWNEELTKHGVDLGEDPGPPSAADACAQCGGAEGLKMVQGRVPLKRNQWLPESELMCCTCRKANKGYWRYNPLTGKKGGEGV